MFGLGVPELIFILVAALLLFGPRRLPEIGRTLGRGMAEFRRASNELKRSLDTELIEEELRSTKEAVEQHDPRRYLRELTTADAGGTVPREKKAPVEDAPAEEDESSPPAALEEPAPSTPDPSR